MVAAEIVGYSFGALCFVTAVPLSLRKTSGASGSLSAFGITLEGKGMAALFLLVGAALVLTVISLSMTRHDLQETKVQLDDTNKSKDEAVRTAGALSDALKEGAEYVDRLEASVPPHVLEQARVTRPQMRLTLPPDLATELARKRPPH